MKRILIVDDDPALRRTLELILIRDGYTVETAADGAAGVELGTAGEVDLVLLDLRLPKMDGFDVLRELKRLRPTLPVIVITAHDDMETAIEAIRLGALDHLGKPLDLGELRDGIRRAAEVVKVLRTASEPPEHPDREFTPHLIVGRSRAMKTVFKTIGAVADSAATVLIHGESGTGKELVARALHFKGKYRAAPFVPVTCAALASTLLESELFGHEKGAFTGAHQTKAGKFEMAEGGTLFLDEISEVSPDIQVKLLRFLQEREFERVGGTRTFKADVRVIAATNRNLTAMLADGSFRRDLYYRLRVVTIEVPPLRERRDDIPLLVNFFLAKIRRELHRTVEVIADEAMAVLLDHPWPGNVRELENALRRAVLLSPGRVLLPEALQLDDEVEGPQLPLVLQSLQAMEKHHIENVLTHTGWDKSRAAKILGISRPTLNKRIREYGIPNPAG
ncbi:MAG TPA: sigma-54 dependent transcriptional regulator [Deferrisomatales bacterium]|nr:sigma-54 dependent transcriptional regulator [Deferrisomatales bacterium]